ncbi:MAG TPA: CoA transferase [Frankiaceae bacterium]|nr:CoA transferase [Frankiaceae bacterium]
MADGELPLAHLRVLEIATEIAGPYAGKLFADAGADVVKVEAPSGDPMRRHTGGGPLAAGAPESAVDSALFAFLNTSKRSVLGAADDVEILALAAAADVVIVDAGVSPEALSGLRGARAASVVVAVTPFGLTGPSAGEPATEFTLQARCGSTGGRGLTDRIPLSAGGRLGEWIGGAYAAVAGAAYVRRAREHGVGELVDVSLLESMAITMGGLGVVAAQIMGVGLGRSLELPSIEATADGYVGYCTITGQQFQDFLVMIERPEWLGDADLASFAGRQRRREEFTAAVREWTARRTTAEIIEVASAMRIPVAPIGSPDTITGIDHFVQRGVFVENPAGFVQPRPPYRIHGGRLREFAAAPGLGEHTGEVQWAAAEPAPMSGTAADPLADIRVMDFTAFWAGPAGSLVLGSLGADVVKVEGIKRPDGMRFAGAKPATVDHWWETGSIFLAVNENKRDVTLELGTPKGDELARRVLGTCDVVMENFSPRVMTNLGLDWDTVSAVNPSALMVRMPAFGLDGLWRDRVGFAQTMEQVSGMAWLTGEADGAPVIPRGACDPIAGLHAAFAAIVGLEHRRRTGSGALVEVTMVEAALNVAAQLVIEHSAYGRTMMRDGNRGPMAAPQGVYRSAGDDRWVAIAVTSDEQWAALCDVLGADALAGVDRRRGADEIDAAIEAWTAKLNAREAAEMLQTLGIPAAPVTLSAELLDDPQLQGRGFFEQLDHPYVGTIQWPAMPIVLGTDGHRWLRRAAPTLGQHNAEILGDLLGLDASTLAALEAERVIGTRPAGL